MLGVSTRGEKAPFSRATWTPVKIDIWRWEDNISNGTGNATTGSNSGGRGSSSHVRHKAATSSNGKIASATVLGMRRQAIIVVDAVILVMTNKRLLKDA
ncbi:hypothetical protein F2Q69_00004945 [Brassica cretica]|uniref:Uncharacterized protein n=1 Tax=Brassica cretica TaxID=69181 RepID=A0A8S9NVY0_BRACR|nr:hypothetical protein F2Q69_00004945 [Brassica cretica]